MKVGQYGCTLVGDGLRDSLDIAIETIEDLSQEGPFDYSVVIWSNNIPFGGKELARFPQLKLLINMGTDDGNLDEVLLERNGVIVKKVDFYSIETLAEYIVSLLLIFERQHMRLQAGERAIGREIYGKKVGILGLGKIGFCTAEKLRKGFGCEIFYNATKDKRLPGYTFLPLEDLFQACDYVIVTAKSGRFTVDVQRLASSLNPELVVVNVSSDAILPLKDLLPLLRARALRGYVGDLKTDLAADELPDNAMLFPHRGYLTRESGELREYIAAYYIAQATPGPWPLYLVQTGETEMQQHGLLQGRAESPLTGKGIADAQKVAAQLRGKGVERIFTSPSKEAQQTARIIAEAIGAEMVVVPGFHEIDLGAFAGHSEDAVKRLFPEFEGNGPYACFVSYPGGESLYDVYVRAVRPLFRILAKRQACAIVGHARVNQVLQGLIAGETPEAVAGDALLPGRLVRLDPAAGQETAVIS